MTYVWLMCTLYDQRLDQIWVNLNCMDFGNGETDIIPKLILTKLVDNEYEVKVM